MARSVSCTILAYNEELTLEQSGGFWHQNGERLPW